MNNMNMNNLNMQNLAALNQIGGISPMGQIGQIGQVSMNQLNNPNMINQINPAFFPKMNMMNQNKPTNVETQNYHEDGNWKKYGLAKIEEVLKNTNPELAIFNFGIDLTKFGLNLNSEQEIYSTFGSPFSENPIRYDRQNLKIPECYLQPNLQLSKDFFKRFKDEILFYIFYNYKDETVQMMAVEELYTRDWRYFLKWETWVKDLVESKENNFECKYFHVKHWTVKTLQNLEINPATDLCKLEQFREGLQSPNW